MLALASPGRAQVAIAQVAIAQVAIAQVAIAQDAARGDAIPPGALTIAEGRYTVAYYSDEARLARSLLQEALARDSFPGLPRPTASVLLLLAPDAERFRVWVGASAPEWGDAIAFPVEQRIVMYGRDAAARSGDPRITLRHELAHLALHEVLGAAVPRWFDEGYASYAAGEWGRDEVIATSVGLVWRGLPTLAGLDSGFYGGSEVAQRSYALAHRAVAELAGLAPDRGLALLFNHWRREGTFERALRRAHGMSSADFERHWRLRIRRQYGALALAADLTVLSAFLLLLLGPMWWQRRTRQRLRLERMRQADAAQEARERASALAALLGEDVTESPGDDRIKGS
ncbi:MAG: hypothetical protein KF709_13550 [Gemmatimonadaceae bacterium]|nr:hypothetical protein [Gemmatimonadaceae bacterium]